MLSLYGTPIHTAIGYVSLIGMALMAPLDARFDYALSKRQLEVALAVFLLLVAARFVVGLL